MNSTKRGRLFAVLMIALIAYGFSSSVCMVLKPSFAVEIPTQILPAEERLETAGNPGFQPVTLRKHVMNITNNTTANETQELIYINTTKSRNNTRWNTD